MIRTKLIFNEMSKPEFLKHFSIGYTIFSNLDTYDEIQVYLAFQTNRNKQIKIQNYQICEFEKFFNSSKYFKCIDIKQYDTFPGFYLIEITLKLTKIFKRKIKNNSYNLFTKIFKIPNTQEELNFKDDIYDKKFIDKCKFFI